MSKNYSVNMLIALFTDFKEDGFHTLSESEVLEALQSLNAAEHTLAGGRLEIVRVFDESEVEEVEVGEFQVKSAAAKA